MNKAVVKTLKTGRKRIEQGWGRGKLRKTMSDGKTHYCAVGALPATGSFDAALIALGRALPEQYARMIMTYDGVPHGTFGAVTEFNDDQKPKNGKRAVLRLYDRAIRQEQAA